MQVPIQGQWWSNCCTHTLQSVQWKALGGLKIQQVLQYFNLSTAPLNICSKYTLSIAAGFVGSFIRVEYIVGAFNGPLANGNSCLGIYPGLLVAIINNNIIENIDNKILNAWTHTEKPIPIVERKITSDEKIIRKVINVLL